MGCCSSRDASQLPYHEHDILAREAVDIGDALKLKLKDDYAPFVAYCVHDIGAADDGFAKMDGSETLRLGREMLRKIRDELISLFPADSVDDCLDTMEEVDELLTTLRMQHLKADFLSQRDLFEKFDEHKYGNSVVKFLDSIIERGVAKNPGIVAFLAEVSKLDAEHQQRMVPPKSAERDKDLRRAIAHCFLLDCITKACLFEPVKSVSGVETLACEKFMSHCHKLLDEELDWKPYCNLFERMKVPSVLFPVSRRLFPLKTDEKMEYDPSSPAILAGNILEACYQNVKLGHNDNAECGYEIMIEGAFRDPIKGTQNDQTRLINDELRVPVSFPSFPGVWSNIYGSWNMAFVSQYRNWPMFFAKLLCPSVGCFYQDTHPGLYLSPRAVALLAHIVYLMSERVERKSDIPGGLDWRDPMLTLLFGKVNRVCGDAFQHRVEHAIQEHNGLGRRIVYNFKRASTTASWVSIRGMVKGKTRLGDAFDDDHVALEYADVHHQVLGDETALEETTAADNEDGSVVANPAKEGEVIRSIPTVVADEYRSGAGIRFRNEIMLQAFDLMFLADSYSDEQLEASMDKILQEQEADEETKRHTMKHLSSQIYSYVGVIVTKACLGPKAPKAMKDGVLYVWDGASFAEELEAPKSPVESARDEDSNADNKVPLPPSFRTLEGLCESTSILLGAARLAPATRNLVDAAVATKKFQDLIAALDETTTTTTEPFPAEAGEDGGWALRAVTASIQSPLSTCASRVAVTMRYLGFLLSEPELDLRRLKDAHGEETDATKKDELAAAIQYEEERMAALSSSGLKPEAYWTVLPTTFLSSAHKQLMVPMVRLPWILVNTKDAGRTGLCPSKAQF